MLPEAVAKALSDVKTAVERYSFLAILERMAWEPFVKVKEKIEPQKEVVAVDFSGAGFLNYVFVRVDNPDVIAQLDLHADGRVELAVTPRELYEMGYTQSIGGFRVLKYSPSQSDYVIEFAPGMLNTFGVPFRGKCRLTLKNPTTATATYTLYAWVIRVKEV